MNFAQDTIQYKNEQLQQSHPIIHIHNNLCCCRLFHIKSAGYFVAYFEVLCLVIFTSYFFTQIVVQGITLSTMLLIPFSLIQLSFTVILYQGLATYNNFLLIMSILGFVARLVFTITYLPSILLPMFVLKCIILLFYTFLILISTYVIYRCYCYYQKISSIIKNILFYLMKILIKF
uniref:Transmembrane protein n=1 Tax=Rhabditophanes sp. KR3021 TaxID=114890 RepID=A0AC35U663_9BILA